jgi:small subunit ribosomal protein S8
MAKNKALANFCSSIKNGQKARKLEITIRNTKLNEKILKTLISEGYVRGFSKSNSNLINVLLKYSSEKPVISKIQPILSYNLNKHISFNALLKRRKELDNGHKGLETFILTTSQGILSDYECLKRKIGGQLLVKIL